MSTHFDAYTDHFKLHLSPNFVPWHNGLPVYRMRAAGVACIGRREQPLLGIKPY